jgi:hypothetical protein
MAKLVITMDNTVIALGICYLFDHALTAKQCACPVYDIGQNRTGA